MVACRPSDGIGDRNRPPTDVEMLNCRERLHAVIDIVRPTLVVLCGKVALSNFSPGAWVPPIGPEGIYHPSYICRIGNYFSHRRSNHRTCTLQDSDHASSTIRNRYVKLVRLNET